MTAAGCDGPAEATARGYSRGVMGRRVMARDMMEEDNTVPLEDTPREACSR